MTTATYSCQVAWTSLLAGVFVISTSKLNGTDVIGSDFIGSVFEDITNDVKSIGIRRGRDNVLSAMDQGSCTMLLVDENGHYNPENAASPLAGNLVPMRPVKITGTLSGTEYPLFYGYISRIEFDPEARESLIEAVDLFEWLGTFCPVIAEVNDKTVGYIIGLILDSLYYTVPSMRSLSSAGSVVPAWSADGTATGLELIEQLLTIDLGAFYISAGGVATYKDRNQFYCNTSTAVDLPDTMTGSIRTSVEVDSIINGQAVTRTGGVTQTAANEASQRRYGIRYGSPITSDYIESDGVAAILANWLVAYKGVPKSPAREITLINRDDTALALALDIDLTDLVNLSETRGSTAMKGRVQGITHEISEGMTIHQTAYIVEKVSLSAFTLDLSELDGTDIIGF